MNTTEPIEERDDHQPQVVDCEGCGGEGTIYNPEKDYDATCPTCKGKGHYTINAEWDVY